MNLDAKTLASTIISLISKLNVTPIRRIVIYAIIIYPLFFSFYYKDEVLTLLTSKKDGQIKVRKLDIAIKRCFNLRKAYGAEAVMFYIYQPNTVVKTDKERIAVSSSPMYSLLEQNDNIRLISRTHVLEDLRNRGFAKITASSKHVLSSVLFTYKLEVAYVVPIRDNNTTAIIGEILYVFSLDKNIDINSLKTAAQMFAYDFN